MVDIKDIKNRVDGIRKRYTRADGNVRVLYGVAKGNGVDIENMNPSEICDALVDEGISPNGIYNALREGITGKRIGESAKVTARNGKLKKKYKLSKGSVIIDSDSGDQKCNSSDLKNIRVAPMRNGNGMKRVVADLNKDCVTLAVDITADDAEAAVAFVMNELGL